MRKSILTLTRANWFQTSLHKAGNRVADWLLPQCCLLCQGPSGGAPVCPGCEQDLPRLSERHCPICRESTSLGERCGACLARPPHFDQCVALYSYAFPVDRLIHELKFGAELALAPWFGKALAGLAPTDGDLVMALPLHPSRLAERGYNQAGEIARHLAGQAGLELDLRSALRERATPPQAELTLKARKTNPRGAFACRRDLAGRHVLLVDDVLTTGATLDEMARVLKLHGASRVSACVVARTLRHGLAAD